MPHSGLSKRFVDLLLGVQPIQAAITAFGLGLPIVIWGIAGYNDTKFAPDKYEGVIKDVGFGLALNWSVTFVIVFPAIVYGLHATMQRMCKALSELAQRRMVVSAALQPITEEELAGAWQARLQRGTKWLLPLVVLAFGYSLYEWWGYSGHSLKHEQLPFDSKSGEREGDWSIAAILDPAGELRTDVDPLTRGLNGAFSFVCFLAQGVWASYFGLAIWLLMMIAFFVLDLSRHRGASRVLPDVRSADQRRGFERFEGVIEYCLLTLAAFYAMFYLSRVWNLYLRSPDEELGAFMVASFSRRGLSAAVASFDYSSTVVAFGAFVAMGLALLIIWMVLRQAAGDARSFFRDQLDERPEFLVEFTGIAPQQARRQLDTMAVWPLSNLSATVLLVALGVATVSILFYQLAPVAAVALVLWQVWPTRPADAPPRLAREHFGEDFMELQAALVAAFPTPSDLQQLVDASLNVNIHAIAREGNLNERVIDVLHWAREQGRMQDLVDGARKRNPDSPKLRTIDDTLVARLAAE